MHRPHPLPLLRRVPLCALCLWLFAGCYAMPTSPHETRGGVSVRTGGAGAPAGPRVLAEAGNFATARGFARQPRPVGPPTPGQERYVLGETILEVTLVPSENRVILYLHGPGNLHSDTVIKRFVRDYRRDFAAPYGAGTISETGYAVE